MPDAVERCCGIITTDNRIRAFLCAFCAFCGKISLGANCKEVLDGTHPSCRVLLPLCYTIPKPLLAIGFLLLFYQVHSHHHIIRQLSMVLSGENMLHWLRFLCIRNACMKGNKNETTERGPYADTAPSAFIGIVIYSVLFPWQSQKYRPAVIDFIRSGK